MELWAQITTVLGAVAIIGSFIFWHFRTVNSFKDEIHRLERRCDGHATKEQVNKIELQQKDLEKSDALQQQTLDQLPQLLPIIHVAMKHLEESKKNG